MSNPKIFEHGTELENRICILQAYIHLRTGKEVEIKPPETSYEMTFFTIAFGNALLFFQNHNAEFAEIPKASSFYNRYHYHEFKSGGFNDRNTGNGFKSSFENSFNESWEKAFKDIYDILGSV